jgi:tyrosinase
MRVANQFPEGEVRNAYRAAASTLRIPYWDWAVAAPFGQNTLPDSVAQPTITVITPNGSQIIDNPLYAYTFNPMDSGLYWQQFLQWPQTLRRPNSTDADAVTQVDQLLSTLNNQQSSWSQRIYNLFVLDNKYNFMDFSNEIFNPKSDSFQVDSIESVHNSIHTEIGGPNIGHMGVIDVAAFDPIFWMHHAMVDRCFALWQAIYPQTYVEPYAQSVPSYWYNVDQVIDEKSNLLPFHSDASGGFWTSDSVRNVTAFSYTYPELESGNVKDVITAINKLYGGQSFGSFSKDKRQTYSNNDTTSNAKQYIANVKTKKYALDTSYSIYFFLGKPGSDPSQWPFDSSLVGTMGVMSTMQSDNLEPVVISGSVPLTKKIHEYVEQGVISSMDDNVVTAYLKCELQWTVMMVCQIPPTKTILPHVHRSLRADWRLYRLMALLSTLTTSLVLSSLSSVWRCSLRLRLISSLHLLMHRRRIRTLPQGRPEGCLIPLLLIKMMLLPSS